LCGGGHSPPTTHFHSFLPCLLCMWGWRHCLPFPLVPLIPLESVEPTCVVVSSFVTLVSVVELGLLLCVGHTPTIWWRLVPLRGGRGIRVL
jgi:hypothetical protein